MKSGKLLFAIASATSAAIGASALVGAGVVASIASYRSDQSDASATAATGRRTESDESGRSRRLGERFDVNAKRYLDPIFRPP